MPVKGYYHATRHTAADCEQLANAMMAYAKLLQKHGVVA